MKATSKAVKESRERSGVSATSFAFSSTEKAAIDQLAYTLGVSRKEAILMAVSAYGKNEISKADLLALLAKRLK